ncbi:MAG: Fur family transcriptional regulator [Lentimicrobium sp.]
MLAIDILQQHQLKKTSPRLAIIEALQSSEAPLAEAEISEKMGSHYDRTTFYRSIQTLMEAGILHRIVVDKMLVKYALNRIEHTSKNQPDHAHFYCSNCKKLICLVEIHPGPYRLPAGFQTSEAEVIIKGLCNKCS